MEKRKHRNKESSKSEIFCHKERENYLRKTSLIPLITGLWEGRRKIGEKKHVHSFNVHNQLWMVQIRKCNSCLHLIRSSRIFEAVELKLSQKIMVPGEDLLLNNRSLA